MYGLATALKGRHRCPRRFQERYRSYALDAWGEEHSKRVSFLKPLLYEPFKIRPIILQRKHYIKYRILIIMLEDVRA
jgi:hypothetical protein